VEDIENLLFYEHGDIHLILSDLYSVVDVPDITDSGVSLRVFHASLQDFLMDPSRSGAFYLDEGIICAQLTQCFIQHIRNLFYSTVKMNPGTVDNLASTEFVKICVKSSPTIELIQDFLIFDFRHWTSATCSNSFDPLKIFEGVVLLSAWFRIHESVTKQYFGPRFSLYYHHSRARDEIINTLLRVLLREEYFSRGDVGKLKMAAITHPILLDYQKRLTMLNILGFKEAIPGQFYPDQLFFPNNNDGVGPDCILETQNFLLERNRAGGCYVSGKTYSELALRIWDFILNATPNEWLNRIDYCNSLLPETLQLAIQTLPFYLTKADYTSKLADSLLIDKLDRKIVKEYPSDITLLQEAIDLYLKRKVQETTG